MGSRGEKKEEGTVTGKEIDMRKIERDGRGIGYRYRDGRGIGTEGV